MRQVLKYGLLQPLRSFEVPDHWDGTQTLTVEGGTFEMREGSATITLAPGSETLFLRRNIAGAVNTRTDITVPAGVVVRVTEEISGEGALRNTTTLLVERGAHVTYDILQDLSNKSIALLTYHGRAAHSTLQWLLCATGADTTHAEIYTEAGERSETQTNAVVLGAGAQQFDIRVATEHTGPGSTSSMLTRSVLAGRSRGLYRGLIRIGPHAPECDSYQKDEALLLGEHSAADAVPDLEIRNNRVRCSHGATIGKIDDEQLLYLQSRGIPLPTAKQMITEGFLKPLIPLPWHTLLTERISRS